MANDLKFAAEQYEKNGFSVIRGFATDEEVKEMKAEILKLIDVWDMNESRGSIFSTDPNEKHINNDYFVGSSETIRFFFEPDAIDPGTSNVRTDLPKERLINKIGHAMHVQNDVFRKYSFSDKVKNLVAALGYQDPVLPQSMYIFKQPGIGGAVTSHQDSTFLHTEPKLTCLGLWLALDNADTSNGCLWVRPGSHRPDLRRLCFPVIFILPFHPSFVQGATQKEVLKDGQGGRRVCEVFISRRRSASFLLRIHCPPWRLVRNMKAASTIPRQTSSVSIISAACVFIVSAACALPHPEDAGPAQEANSARAQPRDARNASERARHTGYCLQCA